MQKGVIHFCQRLFPGMGLLGGQVCLRRIYLWPVSLSSTLCGTGRSQRSTTHSSRNGLQQGRVCCVEGYVQAQETPTVTERSWYLRT